jgi:hypothetical protein
MCQRAPQVGESVDLRYDSRSVHSMLDGRDDGRVAVYERFHWKLNSVAPILDTFAIEACYRRFEFASRLAVAWLPRKWHMSASRWLMYARTYGNPTRWLMGAEVPLGHRE